VFVTRCNQFPRSHCSFYTNPTLLGLNNFCNEVTFNRTRQQARPNDHRHEINSTPKILLPFKKHYPHFLPSVSNTQPWIQSSLVGPCSTIKVCTSSVLGELTVMRLPKHGPLVTAGLLSIGLAIAHAARDFAKAQLESQVPSLTLC